MEGIGSPFLFDCCSILKLRSYTRGLLSSSSSSSSLSSSLSFSSSSSPSSSFASQLKIREDGRQQVCIVGLKEFIVSDIRVVQDLIDKGSASRSTGSTGANEESSRSHAILQLVVKKHVKVGEKKGRRTKEDEEKDALGKLVGKFSFIDLAGSERGADTTDNDKQTRYIQLQKHKSWTSKL